MTSVTHLQKHRYVYVKKKKKEFIFSVVTTLDEIYQFSLVAVYYAMPQQTHSVIITLSYRSDRFFFRRRCKFETWGTNLEKRLFTFVVLRPFSHGQVSPV